VRAGRDLLSGTTCAPPRPSSPSGCQEEIRVDLFDLTGRAAVVPGAGIGFMIAAGLLRAGATVVLSSRAGRT
jgi:hypothetical protein